MYLLQADDLVLSKNSLDSGSILHPNHSIDLRIQACSGSSNTKAAIQVSRGGITCQGSVRRLCCVLVHSPC